MDGSRLGIVGNYAAADQAAGVAVLTRGMQLLAAAGFKAAVGPMDGNTWKRYRFVTERAIGNMAEPTFFMEPDQPDEWPAHFLAAGFEPLARYTSALNDDLSVSDPRFGRAMERFAKGGVRILPIDPSRFTEELRAVHRLSLAAFAKNFLYTPIGLEEFLAMYEPLRGRITPELILLAKRQDDLVGFMFGTPDYLELQRLGVRRTAIGKTLAVQPGRCGAGLGSVLMEQFQRNARELGFSRVIHALMHEDNRSLKISAHTGHTMRRYTLFRRSIPT